MIQPQSSLQDEQLSFMASHVSNIATNFYWATTTIKGRLLSSRPLLKPFSGEKNSKSRRNGAQKYMCNDEMHHNLNA